MTRERFGVGLSGVAAVLPSEWRGLDELEAAGLLVSPARTLAEFGFEGAHICSPDSRPEQMAFDAAKAALLDAGLQPRDIDAVIWASARAENHILRSDARPETPASEVLAGFRYGSGWLQDELDLRNADALAVAQQGCSTMFSALRLARALVMSEPDRCQHVLCVGVDVLPAGAPREILYNVISDGACAVVVSRDSATDRWIGFRQISQSYLWDTAACGAEIIAAYFPVARLLIQQLLSDHNLQPGEVDVVIPTAVNRSSWDLLLRLADIPKDRLYRGLAGFSHTMTSDSFLFLQSLRRDAAVRRGSRLLLFTYGFGSSWSGLLLEH